MYIDKYTPQKYVPPHRRNISKNEPDPPREIVPVNQKEHEEACKKGNPYKMNFLQAIKSNDKNFDTKAMKTNVLHHYDYICCKCSKQVKREGLNNNNTNYCWQCHSEIIFKNNHIIINDEDDDEYMGVPLQRRYEIRYQNYLYSLEYGDAPIYD